MSSQSPGPDTFFPLPRSRVTFNEVLLVHGWVLLKGWLEILNVPFIKQQKVEVCTKEDRYFSHLVGYHLSFIEFLILMF